MVANLLIRKERPESVPDIIAVQHFHGDNSIIQNVED